jgi:hypothetical protein
MKKQTNKTFTSSVVKMSLFLSAFFLFISLNNADAQSNKWKTSAPNPPSGLSTDASGLVSNGAKSFDFDQFKSEVERERDEVTNDPNFSDDEKKVRLKVLDESVLRAEQGFAIAPSFDIALMRYEDIVENKTPSVDLSAIVEEYKLQFEQ